MKNSGLHKIAALLIFSLALLSCIDIDSRITLQENGSGKLELIYTVSSTAMRFGASDPASGVLPIPVDEADFRRSVLAVQGLSLESYSRSEQGENTVITAVMGFTGLEALNRFVGGEEQTFTLNRSENRTTFEQLISPGSGEETDERYRQFLSSFLSPYKLKFTLSTPRPVTRSVPEGVSVSDREAEVTFPLIEVVESPDPVKWIVEW